jgi:hypothetical protein
MRDLIDDRIENLNVIDNVYNIFKIKIASLGISLEELKSQLPWKIRNKLW